MTPTCVRRLATAGAAAAVFLGGGLASAPSAAAAPTEGKSSVTQPVAQDQGPSPRTKIKLKDGCFTATYENDTWASVTLYFKNHCKRAHRLHIDALGAGGEDKTVTVKGHTKGSKRYWNWTSGFEIYDYGRA